MPKRSKYPSPIEAMTRYIRKVELAKEAWVQGAREGASQYQAWYTGFANQIYPLISGLPEKTGDVEKDVINRVVPIAKAIRDLARSYRVTKIQKKLGALVAPAVR